jgi:hypothetical protein
MSSGYAADVRGFPEQARHSSNMGAEKQSRRMSLVEAVTNVVVGFGVALLTQIIVFPLFGLRVSLDENVAIGALFTILCGAPHNSVYVESMIMPSPVRQSGGRRGVGAKNHFA